MTTQDTAFASGTSSRINGPSLSSNELPRPYGILKCLMYTTKHIGLLWKDPEMEKIKEPEIMKWDKIKQDIQRSHWDPFLDTTIRTTNDIK